MIPESTKICGYKAKHDWQSTEAAVAYRRSRQPGQFERYELEEAIVTGWLSGVQPGGRVLDIPCGTGRFVQTVTAKGLRYLGGDVSCAMIEEARREVPAQGRLCFVNADAEHIPLADNSVDCVILWRLLHHIRDPRVRQAMLREAARVTRDKVIMSFHHPLSFTAVRKYVHGLFSRQQPRSAAISHWRLQREASACGLRLVQTRSFGKYVSINWFACLVKGTP